MKDFHTGGKVSDGNTPHYLPKGEFIIPRPDPSKAMVEFFSALNAANSSLSNMGSDPTIERASECGKLIAIAEEKKKHLDNQIRLYEIWKQADH